MMTTTSKLFTALFFSSTLAFTTGCSTLEKYISPESSMASEAKKAKQPAGKKTDKKTAKKVEEDDEITVYEVGGYAIKAALVYALIIAFSN